MKRQHISILISLMAAGIFFSSCGAVATLFHGPQPGAPPLTYTVTFDANGASGIAPETRTVNDGDVINLPGGGGLSKTGYVFIGWNENASGSGTNFSAGTIVTVYWDMVFYACWLDESTPQYTVTFNANGATGGTPPASQTVYSGIRITLPNQGSLVNSGKTFSGWNTQANADGTHYLADAAYSVTENVTLYAIWDDSGSQSSYTVTFDSNGGSEVAPQTVNTGGTVTRPPSPTRDRFTFGGWYSEPDFRTVYVFSTPVTRDITLYARWGSIPMNYTFIPYILDSNTLIMNPQRLGDGAGTFTPDDPLCPRFLLEPGTVGTFPIGRWVSDSNSSIVTHWLEFNDKGDFTDHYSYYSESNRPYTRTGNTNSGNIVHNGRTLPYIVNGNTLIFNPLGQGNGTILFTPDDPQCDRFDLVPTTAGTFPIGVWMAQFNYHRSDKDWLSVWVEFTSEGNLVVVYSDLRERDGAYTLGTGEIGLHYWDW